MLYHKDKHMKKLILALFIAIGLSGTLYAQVQKPRVLTIPATNQGVPTIYYATGVAAGATTVETAITLTKASGTAATSTAASQTLTAGRRFHISSIAFTSRGNSVATEQVSVFSLRINTAGAVTTASTPIVLQVRTATGATASALDRIHFSLPDGYEITGTSTLQFGITVNSTYTTNAPTLDVMIIGYVY